MLEQPKAYPDLLGDTGKDETMANQQERLSRLAHLAGLIEGEGWFGLTVTRHTRKNRKKHIEIIPRFAIQMNDTTVIQWAAGVLRENDLAHHVTKDGNRISIVGLKRLSRFDLVIIPQLVGVKRTVAEIQYDWITYRLSRDFHLVNYNETDLEYVNRIRSINAGNGKDKVIPDSILRDYMSHTRPTKTWEFPGEDIVHAPSKAGD